MKRANNKGIGFVLKATTAVYAINITQNLLAWAPHTSCDAA